MNIKSPFHGKATKSFSDRDILWKSKRRQNNEQMETETSKKEEHQTTSIIPKASKKEGERTMSDYILAVLVSVIIGLWAFIVLAFIASLDGIRFTFLYFLLLILLSLYVGLDQPV